MAGPMTLTQIVARLGGRVAAGPDTLIHQVASLESADARHISFFTGKRHRAKLDATRAAAVIVAPDAEGDTARPRIVAENPYLYFARVSQLFNPLTAQPPGVHPSAVVAKSAKLGARVSIGAGCVVGEEVAIGDDVEIGANTTIDRGALDDTIIEEGVKLDNQIQIGHNTRIGAHTAIAGCVGIAGSADIGRHCTFGGAAMILGHLKIVDHVNISAGTFISRSILKPGTYTGIWPVDEHDSWARAAAWLRRKRKKHD